MKVYVVTEGDYSDYHIEAIFLSYGQAVKYIELHSNEPCYYRRIEQYDVNRLAPKTDRLMWNVEYNGNLWKTRRTEETTWDEPGLRSCRWLDDVYPYDEFHMTVFAKDELHALKIARDVYAKMKAEKEGIAL